MRYVALLEIDNDVLIAGDSCCTNLTELYTALVDINTTEIVISKAFAEEHFTYVGLCNFVEQCASLVPHIRIVVPDVVYNNTLEAVRELREFREPGIFIYALEKQPSRVLSTIQELCNEYLSTHDEANAASSKIATMLVQIDDLQKQVKYAKRDYDALLETKNDLEAKLHALVSRVNFKYEKTVSPDSMFLATENAYNHVLYIKEITRVHYTDTLMYYVQEIIKTMYNVPVRSIVIEPYYAYGRASLYPNHVPHWELKYSDVYSGDIMMAGFQPNLMRDILKDASHVNYLIILDRGGYSVPHVNCGNCTTVYTASDLKDLEKDFDPERVISYSEETLNIPYIEGFDDLSIEDKIQKYSSMDVVKKLINILEEVK